MARIDPHASATHRTRRIDGLWGNRAFWTVALLACFALLSAAKPVVLHDGGAVTYFSLLFLWLASYFFGPRYGAACGVVFGIVRLGVTWVTGEYVNFAPGALVLEYPLACGMFALGGFVRGVANGDATAAVEAICRRFNEGEPCGVVPKDPHSACKRVCMFLRWMVRTDSPVDLGLWTDFIDRRTLVIPLDTHVVQEARRLGLLTSACTSMSVARRLTAKLAEVFPDDPCRGDFALFGYGVDESSAAKTGEIA